MCDVHFCCKQGRLGKDLQGNCHGFSAGYWANLYRTSTPEPGQRSDVLSSLTSVGSSFTNGPAPCLGLNAGCRRITLPGGLVTGEVLSSGSWQFVD